MDDQQHHHLEELLRTHYANLRHLESQAAQHGLGVPLSLHNSIVHERNEIVRLEAELARTEAPHFGEDRLGNLRINTRGGNLPAPVTALIGREQEVASVGALLRRADVRLVTLTGPGGTGKTRLALQAAAELRDEFVAGTWFVALAPIRDADLVISSIAQVLGVRPAGARPLTEILKEELRDRQILLLLDNFEHVMDAAPLLGKLLEAAPGLKALATSREALHLYGEHEFAVPPLSLPNLKDLPALDQLIGYESIRLFAERAQAVQAGFAVSHANARMVAEICARLDGLPLAIELAAARCKLFTPDKLLAQLASRLKLLTGGARNLPERQRTLRGAIEWSYNLLDAGEQTLFLRLAVFAGSCTLEAAEAVCNADSELPFEALDGLAALVDKSLLRQETGIDEESRFVMLETIREYALEGLLASTEAEILRRRHAEYYLELARLADPELWELKQVVWLNRLEEEHDNLRVALSWGVESSVEMAAQMGSRMHRFWELRGHLSEGRRWLEAILAKGTTLSERRRGSTLRRAGWLAHMQGDHTHARRLLEESLAILRALGSKSHIAPVLNMLGFVALRQAEYSQAITLYEESLALYQELQDKKAVAMALSNLGQVARLRGDYAQARRLHEESLVVSRELGDTLSTARTLHHLGWDAIQQGDYVQGRKLLEESLEINRKLDDKKDIFRSVHSLGSLALNQANYLEAAKQYEESLEIAREVGDRSDMAEALMSLGRVALHQNNIEQATQLIEEGLDFYHDIGDKQGIANALSHLGTIVSQQGDYRRAAAYYEESLVLYREQRNQRGIAQTLRNLGVTEQLQGKYARAIALCEASLALCYEVGDQRDIAWALDNIGFVAYKQGHYERAAECYDECLAHYREFLGKHTIHYLLYNRGHVAQCQGNIVQAAAYFAESMALYGEQDDSVGIALCLAGSAGVSIAQEQPDRAAQLYGAAEALREQIGDRMPADDRAELDTSIIAARARLDDATFAAAWAAGRAMSLEQAITYMVEQNPINTDN